MMTAPSCRGVYLVTKEGKAYLVANAIDVQEGRDSGVFDESRVYSGNFDEVTRQLFTDTLSGTAIIHGIQR